MTHRVVVQPRAERDIVEAARSIRDRSRSPETALRWSRRLRATIDSLRMSLAHCPVDPDSVVYGRADSVELDQSMLNESNRTLLEEGERMVTSTSQPRIDDPEAVKAEWLGRLDALVREIDGWARASKWRTRRIDKTVEERRLGKYKVPVLFLEKDTVEVVLNPVARFMPGAQGAVDLYLAPAYDDIASLYFEGGRWVVHYGGRPDPMATSGTVEPEPQPYSEQTIRNILDKMVAHG